jgi:hypothetical protein
VQLVDLRTSLERRLQAISDSMEELMSSSRDFYSIRDVLEEHEDYKDQLTPSWLNLKRRYTELCDEYRTHALSLAEADDSSVSDLAAALVDSYDPSIVALATRLEKQHELAIAEGDEVVSELEAWIDELRDEYAKVQSEYEGNVSNMALRKVGKQVQFRLLHQWREYAAQRIRLRRISAKLGLSTQQGALFAGFRAWHAYAAEASRTRATLHLARKKMDKVWLRTAFVDLRRRCATRRYSRLQAEYVRAEKQALLSQTDVARLQLLQMRCMFNSWNQVLVTRRKALRQRATARLRLSLTRSIWRRWCRYIEIESWHRAQLESEMCISEADEQFKSTVDTIRIKAVSAITGRISTLRAYFLLWRAQAIERAREHQSVVVQLSQIEARMSDLQSLFDRWLDEIHAARFVKKHSAALQRERMRSVKVKMRSQKVFIQLTERRIHMDRMTAFFSLWLEFYRAQKQNKHAVTVGLQRLFRSAAANAWEAWIEMLSQARLLRKVTIKIKSLALRNAFDAWDSLKLAAAEEAAELRLKQVHAEAAFGRREQAQVRYMFDSWNQVLMTRRKTKTILARVARRREKLMLVRWSEYIQVVQQERREQAVASELEARQIALDEAQALIDRSALGHLFDPRLVMQRRGFKVWVASWKLSHDRELAGRKMRKIRLRKVWVAWWKRLDERLDELTPAQLAARGRMLHLHGNGPALARWFHNRCNSVTKRIGTELTDLLADSQLYQQSIDIGAEWRMDVPSASGKYGLECNGRFWLQTMPVDTVTRRNTPRKAAQGAAAPASPSPSGRLGNPDVYAASQTRARQLDLGLLEVEDDEAAAAQAGAGGPRRARGNSRVGTRSPTSPATPRRVAAAARGHSIPQLVLDRDDDAQRNCCVFELRME